MGCSLGKKVEQFDLPSIYGAGLTWHQVHHISHYIVVLGDFGVHVWYIYSSYYKLVYKFTSIQEWMTREK